MDDLLAGKTIDRIETSPPNDHNGEPDPARLILYLTDGSMVEIIGGGDDCDEWITIHPLSDGELAKRSLKAAEREQEAKDRKLKHKAWMALTCEERQAEIATRKPDLFGSALKSMWLDAIYDQQRPTWAGTPEHTLTYPCPKCHEQECPNAPKRVIPAKLGLMDANWNTITEPSKRTRARRS